MDAEVTALEPALEIGVQADPVRIARHFRRALLDARRMETPYRHWRLVETLPEWVALGLISLPIAPLLIDDCGGVISRCSERKAWREQEDHEKSCARKRYHV